MRNGAVAAAARRGAAGRQEMGCPGGSAAVSAQGAVKATPGAVNVPVAVGGQLIHPGDAVIADDDGVVCVPRGEVARVLGAAQARAAAEEVSRAALRAGELSLGRYALRAVLQQAGGKYVRGAEHGHRAVG